ncbi:MAG: ParB/RepB/Spo0J family partition protein [Chloroflexi bacterium]|nr:ParB/RepB/Spo0J family partition protein [Chloroflexota bacterium]
MPTAAIKLLKAHPAQMRTTYDRESLATLTLQLFERGLDNWQPIVAAPHGDAYYLVSGHRRHRAQLLAFALRDWAKEHPDTEITIEVVRKMINTLVDSLGSLEKVIASCSPNMAMKTSRLSPLRVVRRRKF